MLTAKAGYKFAQGIAPVFADGIVSNITLSGDMEQNVLGFTVTYPATAAAEETEKPAQSAQPTEKAEASQDTRQQSQGAAKASGGSSAGGGGTVSAPEIQQSLQPARTARKNRLKLWRLRRLSATM